MSTASLSDVMNPIDPVHKLRNYFSLRWLWPGFAHKSSKMGILSYLCAHSPSKPISPVPSTGVIG